VTELQILSSAYGQQHLAHMAHLSWRYPLLSTLLNMQQGPKWSVLCPQK